MNNVIPFKFNLNDIRVVDTQEEPLFVAKDVADLLKYTNSRKAVSDHCKGVTKRYIPTSSGEQQVSLIPERDVYRLIMRSKLPEAEKFEEWVVSEVIPSIRKKGGYQAPRPNLSRLEILNMAIEAEKQSIELKEQLAIAKPKAEFADAVMNSTNAITVQDFAKLMGTGQNKMFLALRTHGYLMAGGLNHNKPYQKFIDQGLFRLQEGVFKNNHGESNTYFKTMITGKGQQYFQQHLLAKIA
ncbi:phage antirepressor KilAC domain-containing protein [Glaciecola sp. 2405UD65-10]|uniref:phage antirepressor KilAC domain-containing protein n=1 Tax=Glaciecola sp. 2405UD65-10 TaxID=3397244 RepID=UPI003B5B1227